MQLERKHCVNFVDQVLLFLTEGSLVNKKGLTSLQPKRDLLSQDQYLHKPLQQTMNDVTQLGLSGCMAQCIKVLVKQQFLLDTKPNLGI